MYSNERFNTKEMISKTSSFLFSHNWLAVFYFNFKMLPFKQAIKLPFDFGRKIRFMNLSGKVKIQSNNIYRGMIKIGFHGSDMFPGLTTTVDLRGSLIINGTCSIGSGSLLRNEQNGCIVLGEKIVIGAKSIIFCENSIEIDNNTVTSWNCQIMDTDTHSIEDLITFKVAKRSGRIFIGKNCWIGNNVLINKSVVLLDNTIVASFSLCNKDYSKIAPPFCIIGGIPAKLIAENKKRTGDKL